MDKQEIISFIQRQIMTGKISNEELLQIAHSTSSMVSGETVPIKTEKNESSKNVSHAFYAIGAIIVVVGVGILIAQYWSDIGFWGRIMVTLGLAVLTYVSGLLLYKPNQNAISQIMFTIAAALSPLGTLVLLQEIDINMTWLTHISIALILALIFGSALVISKRSVLLLITVGFISWAYYVFVLKVAGFDYFEVEILKWASIILGVSYLLVGYGYKALSSFNSSDGADKRSVVGVLYALGTLGVLGGGIFIGGIFDLIFVPIIFAVFYGSIYVRSRSMLILGALFLMAHIVKLTSEYFVDSVGWPLALIVIGFLIIGVGYLTYYLNKKFINQKV